MNLVAAEAELFAERFRRRLRNSKPSPAEVEKVELDMQRFGDRLGTPKN
jgi:hypothetical protein